MSIGAGCVYPEVSGGHRDMLHVSLLGESAITDDGTGTVRTRSSRAVVLVAFLVGHAGSPRAGSASPGCSGPSPPMPRR
jgi:hypothetical protein